MGCANFALALNEGRGVKADRARAARLDRQACEKDILLACRRVAERVLRDGDRDRGSAVDALERLCRAKDLPACANLGLMLLRGDGAPLDRERAIELHRRACDGGLEVACTRLKTLESGTRR